MYLAWPAEKASFTRRARGSVVLGMFETLSRFLKANVLFGISKLGKKFGTTEYEVESAFKRNHFFSFELNPS